MRTYPIRVGGNSGPAGTSAEITWEIIQKRSGIRERFAEYTTVTGRMRRVFEQDWEVLKRAVKINGIDQIALMFIDYINAEDFGCEYLADLSCQSRAYIDKVEDELNTPVTLIGTGPLKHHMIDVRDGQQRTPISLQYEDRTKYGFKSNFMGYSWDVGYLEYFIDRKMDWKRRIFVFNHLEEDKLYEAKEVAERVHKILMKAVGTADIQNNSCCLGELCDLVGRWIGRRCTWNVHDRSVQKADQIHSFVYFRELTCTANDVIEMMLETSIGALLG